MEKEFVVRVHKGYRWLVAICDSCLKGKVFDEGEKQLDISTRFFEGDFVNKEELKNIIVKMRSEDATFYIVGDKSVDVVKSVGLVGKDGVMKIAGISFALILL